MVVFPACVSVHYVHLVPAEARGGKSDPLELELQRITSCHVGVGN